MYRESARDGAIAVPGRALLLGALTATLLFLTAAPNAGAATIQVAPGSVAAGADGQCALVEAITNANDNASTFADCAAGSGTSDTLTLASASQYVIALPNNTFYGFTGLPVISTRIEVEGNGATIARDGTAPPLRLLAVAPTGNLAVTETLLSDGLARGGNGGDDSGTDDGGGGGGGAGLGGAILNRGVTRITASTFSGNVAFGGSGGDAGDNVSAGMGGGGAGGGGLGGAGGTSTVANADGGNGGGGFGGSGGAGSTTGGGGGGGTDANGNDGVAATGGAGGNANGGAGGNDQTNGTPGGLGGGGGGGGNEGNGADGGIGGGGGGAGEDDTEATPSTGGNGGFGGGGGGGGEDGSGGNGGFGGGGGGSAPNGAITNEVTGAGGFGGGNAGTGTESNGGGGGAGMGGAIFNDGGRVTVLNSTFSGNVAQGGPGGAGTASSSGDGQSGQGFGGGIFSLNGRVSVTEGTFAGNIGQGGGAYVRQSSGQTATFELRNSILADTGAAAADCFLDGTVTTAGSVTNLVEQNAGCAAVTVTADPALGPLTDNGGPTPTQLQAIGSPAVNAGANAGCTARDQRDVKRPAGRLCDIGATELAPEIERKLSFAYNDRRNVFRGIVKADIAACVRGRVTIFEQERGKDQKAASDKTNRRGRFVAREPDPDPDRYYAKIKQRKIGEITCLVEKSKTKRIG